MNNTNLSTMVLLSESRILTTVSASMNKTIPQYNGIPV